MAEEEDQEEGTPGPATPVGPIKQPSLLRYLPIVLIILAMQAVGVYMGIERYLFQKGGLGSGGENGERPRVIPDSNEPEDSIDLGQFVANPRSEHMRLLLTAEVTLAVAPDDAKGEIEDDAKIDQVKDAVLYELSHATPAELSHRDGRDIVKTRLKTRINELLYEGQVVDIYFSKYIMQALPGYKSE
ncbi:MAG: flagellar basal body-associated protein FliL [Candidatus Latescibacterota bacterium]|jgi:flagellar basal body-associated protein FliL